MIQTTPLVTTGQGEIQAKPLLGSMESPLPVRRAFYRHQETWVQSLGWEDPLEKGIATHSSILAWKIPWTGESGGLQSMGSQSRTQLISTYTYIFK